MARRKASENGAAAPADSAADEVPKTAGARTEPREVIKVNNANLTELKHALDDALKRILGRPDQFKTIHQHTDVRLALGWAGVFVASGTALYGYKTEFEKSKPIVWFGVVLYIILTSVQTLYAYFIEGSIVYVGKRKTFAKRIETERITVESRTRPSTPTSPPKYEISLSYVRSSNSGKSLLHKGKVNDVRGYNAFFDEDGVLDQDIFEEWIRASVDKATGENN
ncbi:microsomal signal peptidase 25 kDa subunit-domain-containing protein [Hysterangium stoloniferum]|nr:microsomal signal peptidase 25 kDa subunit-domain-containing protein [Hysterangium stoloniferum]